MISGMRDLLCVEVEDKAYESTLEARKYSLDLV
jgi:hypothetical protein